MSDFESLRTDEKLGNEVGESREQIRRYIRLTCLVPELLELVDEERLAVRAGVELSYLTEPTQALLLRVAQEPGCRLPSMAQAERLRALLAGREPDEDAIRSILRREKAQAFVKLPLDRISRFFPVNTSSAVMEQTILEALEYYRNNHAPVSV